MTIELIGIVTLIAGIYILRRGPDVGIVLLFCASLLGAAAAFKLPALGGANIMPAHALLPFYCLAVLRMRGGIGNALASLSFPRPGFWLAAFVVYGAITSTFLPRVFWGSTEVFTIAQFSASGRTGVVVLPLAPSNSHITQTVYLLGDLALFVTVMAHMMLGGRQWVLGAALAAAATNIMFAFLDVATYATGTSELLSVIRNANYGILAELSIGGFKRIVGSFTEASTFGGITTYFFVLCAEFWLRGVRRSTSGPLALLSLVLLVLSTSSSTYLGLGFYLGILLLRCGIRLLKGTATLPEAMIVCLLPVGVSLILFALLLIPSFWSAISNLVDSTLVNKATSQSAVERTSWNTQGMKVFFDTIMLGAGVGSVRTSSYIVALLANVGLPGAMLFGLFFASIAATARQKRETRRDPVAVSALWACVTVMVPASVAGSSVDLGLIFHLFAALAASAWVSGTVRLSAPIGVNNATRDGEAMRGPSTVFVHQRA